MTIDIPAPETAPGAQERFIAELRRMNAETEKFVAEQRKLMSEARKFNRDPWLAAVIALSAVLGGFITHYFGK